MKAMVIKYGAFLRIAAAGARQERAEIYGRGIFFVIVLGVFTSLWNAVREAGMPIAAEPASLVWYLAITEWILLSMPMMHMEIQESIRRGDIVCQIGRPVSYVGAVVAEGIGALLVRAPLLFVIACVTASILTGHVPPVRVLLTIVPIGLVATALLTAIYVGLGLAAFWLGDASPLWWVSQKLLFVLGGLMMPLSLYPDAIQRAAAFTPFPAILAGPATLALHESVEGLGALMLSLAGWLVVTMVTLQLLFRRATRTLTMNGG
jgi:ABC-2 type transport system permease protein